MLRAITRHVSASGVLAVIALVFAMTGGAYAAKRYLITSTAQISPKVLKTLKGKPGPAGPAARLVRKAKPAPRAPRARKARPDRPALPARA